MSETISPEVIQLKNSILALNKEYTTTIKDLDKARDLAIDEEKRKATEEREKGKEVDPKSFSYFTPQGRKEIVRIALPIIKEKFSDKKINEINDLIKKIKEFDTVGDIRKDLQKLLETIR